MSTTREALPDLTLQTLASSTLSRHDGNPRTKTRKKRTGTATGKIGRGDNVNEETAFSYLETLGGKGRGDEAIPT